MKKNVITKAAAIITLIIMIFASCSQPDMKDKMTVNEVLYPFFKLVENEDGDWEIKVIAGSGMSDVTVPDSLKTPDGSNATIFGGFESESDRKGVQTVTIEDGITEIKDGAFQGASNLTDIEFSSSSSLDRIGNDAFNGTGLSDVKIPSSVTEIGDGAFANNGNLTDVDLSGLDDNTTVGTGAFDNTPVTNITVSAPNTTKDRMNEIFGNGYLGNVVSAVITGPGTVGNGFDGASDLTSVVIKDGVDGIGNNAFNNASSLANISLPSSVTSIGNNAFNSTTSLTAVELPSSLETIGENAFANCGDDEYTLPSSMKDVAANAFDGNDTVYITYDIYSNRNGEPVGSIVVKRGDSIIAALEEEKDTFAPFENAGVDFVTSFDGSKSGISSTYNDANDSLTLDAKLPSSLSGEAEENFISGKLVVDWRDPNVAYELTEGGESYVAAGLTEAGQQNRPDTVYVSGNHQGKPVTGIKDNAFGSADGNPVDMDVVFSDPSKITDIGSGAFQNNTGIKDDILKDFTNQDLTIGENAFAGTGITESTIPDGLTSIPNGMFNGASNLNSLKNPDGTQENVFENVSSIGKDAFKDTALSNDDPLKGSDVTSIGEGAFQGTDIGPTVTIPSSVTGLGQNSFADNDSIKDVIIESGSGLSADDIAKAFGTTDESGKITKPSSATSLTIPADLVDSQKEIDALVEAFPNLKDLNIVGDGSNELNGSFSGFENLEKVVISGVTTIGKEDPAEGEKGAFEGLGNLTSVTLPEGLEVIGGNAFSGSSLKDVATADENGVVTEEGKGKLPSTVTTIGDNAFADTDLRNPAGIYDAETGEVSGGLFDLIDNNTSNPGLSIGDNAFAGTSVGLAVKLPENTTSVGAGAFDDVALGNTITIPSSVESLGEGAFTGNDRNDSITSVVVEPNASENITGETIADAFADITGDAESGFETNNPASTVKELTIPVDMVDTQEEVDAIHAAFPNLEKITITGGDKGVTTIPSDVSFDKFDKVTDLVIGEGVTGISTTPENEKEGNGTFAGMDSLTSVTLPEGLEIIGDNAFSGNKNLTEVATADKDGVVTEEGRGKLPSVLETVGDNAFANTGISGDVFAGNDGRLTSIGDGAFEGVTGNLGDEDGKLTIPGTVTTIGEDAFKGTDSIKDVTIPSNVESLGSGAFVDTGLTSVTIEDNPNFEGDNREDLHNAFMSKDENGNVTSSSDKVTSLTIPENLFSNTLTPEAFPNVEEIRITESANGANTDEDGIKLGVLEDLKAVTVDGGVDSKVDYTGVNITQISIAADELTENGAPDKLKGKIETVVVVPDEKDENGTRVPGGAFAGAGNIEEVRIEEGILAVGSTGESSKPLLGEEASNSVTVELPSSVGTIGDNTFKGDNITVKLPEEGAENIKTVGDGAFEGNKNVTNDILDKLTGLESIGDNAFKDTGISGEVTIPGTVSDLGSGAFAGNDGITSVVVEPNANDKITGQTIADAFMTENEGGADSVTSLTIPVDMIQSQEDVNALYKAFPNLEKLVITGGTEGSASTIPSDVSFDAFDKVTDLVIGEGVTGISTTPENGTEGNGTFAGMDSLTSVTLSEGLTNIGDNAFSGNESLKNVATSSADGSAVTNGRLPSTVETVGDNAFANTGISGDIFAGNDSLKEIGDGAFSGITGSLGDKDGMLTLPEGLTSIGDNAFNGTESLKGVSASDNGTVTEDGKNKLPSTVTNIGDNAFKDTSLKSPAGEKDSATGVVSGGLFDRIENNPDNEGLTIGEGAFAGTNVGPAVSLPDNTVSVGDGAFAGINNAAGTEPDKIDVKVPAQLTGNPDNDSTEEGLAGIFTDSENITVAIGNLTVTAGDEENEKAVDLINPADGSSVITVDKVILEEGLTSIEDGAFADTGVKEVATLDKENGTSSVTDDVLPGSLENIGKDAFADTSLESPAGNYDEATGEFIGGGLFDRIENNPDNNGLTIGEGAFANTNVGPDVYIPGNTVSVGDGAFSGINGTDGSDISGLNVKAPAKLTADPNGDKDNGLVEIFINPDSEAGADDTPVVIDNLIVSGDDTETGVSDTLGKLTNDDGKDGDVDLILGNVVLEEGVTAVGDNAFSGVGVEDGNSLTVTLPESADKPFTAIGENAFNGGPLAVDSEGKVVKSDPVADLVVGKEDENGTFVEKLPSTVTEIGSGAFLDSGLGKNDENGGLGGTITGEGTPDADITGGFLGDIEGELSIGENAFGNTNIGPTINIPEGTTSVGDGAFTGITPENEDGNGGINVKVPSAITGDHDKNGDGIKEEGSLSDIFIDKNDETTKPVVIDNLIVTGNKVSEDDVVGAIADSAADPSSEGVDVILGNVVIDENVDAVGDNAFTGVGVTGDDYILSVDLPEEGLTSIGDSAFENAPLPVDQDGQLITDGSADGVLDITTGGESGKLPSTVTEIGNNAFKDSGLGNGDENIGGTYDPDKGIVTGGILADLEDTAIGSGAFENTNIGPAVNIPEGVTSIGAGAFAGITPNKTTDPESDGLVVQIPDDLVNGNETGKGIDDYFTTTGSKVPVEFDEIIITGGNIDKLVTDEGKISVDSIVINPENNEDIVISDDAFDGLTVPENEDGEKVLTVTLPDDFDGSITVPSIDPDELGFSVVFKQGDETFGEIVSYTVVYKVGDVEVLKEEPVSYFAGLGTYKLPTENAYMSDMTYTAGGASVADGDLIALKENHEVVATGKSKKISITVNGKVVSADFGNPISDYTDGSYITSASDSLTGKVTEKVSSEEGFTGPKYVIPGLDKIYTVHNVTVESGEYAAAGSVANLSGWYIEGSDISSSIKGVTSSTDGLDFNSWVATTGTAEGGKITGNVTLTPNWKYDITVNNGTSSSTVTAYIGPKDSSGDYTQADLKEAVDKLTPAGGKLGLVAEDSSSVLKSEPSIPSGNVALKPSDVIDKELNVYYQFNATLEKGTIATVAGESISNGNYVVNGSDIKLGGGENVGNSWNCIGYTTGSSSIVNSIHVDGSNVTGSYYPVYQATVNIQGAALEQVNFSYATDFDNRNFNELKGFVTTNGEKYAFGSDNKVTDDDAINGASLITPDTLTDTTISKYYNVTVETDSSVTGLYISGGDIKTLTGYSHVYVSSTPVSSVTGESDNPKVSADTKYVYQVHNVTFNAGTKGNLTGSNTAWYIHGQTISAGVNANNGFDFAGWNPSVANSDNMTSIAQYTPWKMQVQVYENDKLVRTETITITDDGKYPANGIIIEGTENKDYVISDQSTFKPGQNIDVTNKNVVLTYKYYTIGASMGSDPALQGYVVERDGHYYQLYLVGPITRFGTASYPGPDAPINLKQGSIDMLPDEVKATSSGWDITDYAWIEYLWKNETYRSTIRTWIENVALVRGYHHTLYQNLWIKESADPTKFEPQTGYPQAIPYVFFWREPEDVDKYPLYTCGLGNYSTAHDPGNVGSRSNTQFVLLYRQIN